MPALFTSTSMLPEKTSPAARDGRANALPRGHGPTNSTSCPSAERRFEFCAGTRSRSAMTAARNVARTAHNAAPDP